MATTWNAIYLGKLTAVLDPTEGNDVPEKTPAAARARTRL